MENTKNTNRRNANTKKADKNMGILSAAEQKRTWKNYEDLEFTDDFLFCKILKNDPKLAKEIVEVILGREIGDLAMAVSQRSLQFTPYDHGVRLDIYASDDNDVIYNIEMQTVSDSDIGKRTRYYHSMISLDQLEKGKQYRELPQSFVIFICKQAPAALKSDLPVFTFRNICEEDASVELNDEAVTVIVNAAGSREGLSEQMRSFLDYIETSEVSDKLTGLLNREVETARRSEKWRLEYMTLGMKYNEYFDMGKAEGLEQGIECGIQRGADDTLRKLTRRAIEHGKTDAEIMYDLDVTAEFIAECRKASIEA